MPRAGPANEVGVRSAVRCMGLSMLLGCSLLGCEEGTAPGYDGSVAPAASWCSAMCSTYRRCQSGAWPNCLNECQAQNRRVITNLQDSPEF